MMRQLRKKSQWGIILLVLGALTLAGAGGAWGYSYYAVPETSPGYWSDSRSALTDIYATDGWADGTPFKVSWEIKQQNYAFPGTNYFALHYKYTFQVDEKNFSHIILQVSDPVNLAQDFYFNTWLQPSTDSPKTWYGNAPGSPGSNPGMPGYNINQGLYGLKFSGSSTTVTIEFDTWRRPVYGNFYAKDGTDKGLDVYAYNNGFVFDAGNIPGTYVLRDPALNLNKLNEWIAVPDTTGGVVPLPGAALLLGAGLVRLLAYKKRLKQ